MQNEEKKRVGKASINLSAFVWRANRSEQEKKKIGLQDEGEKSKLTTCANLLAYFILLLVIAFFPNTNASVRDDGFFGILWPSDQIWQGERSRRALINQRSRRIFLCSDEWRLRVPPRLQNLGIRAGLVVRPAVRSKRRNARYESSRDCSIYAMATQMKFQAGFTSSMGSNPNGLGH